MVRPSERNKPKKFRRSVKGKAKPVFAGERASKRSCGYCGKSLHGVPHGKTKSGFAGLSRSKRRPSVPLGGVLCGSCRAIVFEEAAKLKHGLKGIGEVSIELRKFAEQVSKRIE